MFVCLYGERAERRDWLVRTCRRAHRTAARPRETHKITASSEQAQGCDRDADADAGLGACAQSSRLFGADADLLQRNGNVSAPQQRGGLPKPGARWLCTVQFLMGTLEVVVTENKESCGAPPALGDT